MRFTIAAVRLLVFVSAFAAVDDAAAQRPMYRCSTDGRVYLSDRPCEGRPATAIGSIGPTRDERSAYRSSNERSPNKAADYLGYLGPECAELNEGLRNGPSRGLGSRAYEELRNSYRDRCGEEERVARSRFAEDQSKKADARRRDQQAEASELDRRKLSREQCDEMYRIIHGRRQKVATMSPGERSDFDRFEATWQARCKSS